VDRFLKQLGAVLALSLRAIPSRIASTTAAIAGFAVVSGVLITVLALASGVFTMWSSAGSNDVAVILQKGAFSEMGSQLSATTVSQLVQAPGLDHSLKEPISPELLVTTDLPRSSDGQMVSALVRGFTNAPQNNNSEFVIDSGRMFRPGVDEVVVGRKLSNVLKNVAIGSVVNINLHPFRIVGIFKSNSSIRESEIWGDAASIGDVVGTPNQTNVAYVKLGSPADYKKLAAYVAAVPGLDVDVYRESEYLQRQGAQFKKIILVPGAVIIALMGIAAMLAAANTMQSSIQARLRELATLRAIGFGAGCVAFALVFEAAILGFVGGAAGSILAGGFFHNVSGITSNGTNAMAFTMIVTPIALLGTVLFSIVVGILGGIWPAVVVARKKVAEALRHT
jgi:putative ABC transport system permease protein